MYVTPRQSIDERLKVARKFGPDGLSLDFDDADNIFNDGIPEGRGKPSARSEFAPTSVAGAGSGAGAPNGTFSWLDLGATWNFATQNNALSGSSAESDELLMDSGTSPFDMTFLTDYSLLEGDNPNLIF